MGSFELDSYDLPLVCF